jgi:hypothetical protein
MKKIILQIHDKSINKTTGELQQVAVPINRKLKESDQEDDQEIGLLIKNGGPMKEHNILLYVENLKATVTGHFEYSVIGEKPDKTHIIQIKEFKLDILHG